MAFGPITARTSASHRCRAGSLKSETQVTTVPPTVASRVNCHLASLKKPERVATLPGDPLTARSP